MKRKKREPFVADRPPGPNRRFRKTRAEVAHAFTVRCQAMGLSVSFDEVVKIIEDQKNDSVVAELVLAWYTEELSLGVEVIP